jgi:hypothetical protein
LSSFAIFTRNRVRLEFGFPAFYEIVKPGGPKLVAVGSKADQAHELGWHHNFRVKR